MTMRRKPNVNQFLEAGASSEVPDKGKGRGAHISSDTEERIAKVMRLRKRLALALKRRVVDESEKRGVRVTENEIIERALAKELGIKL
jgi:Holliday junction resolvasome RuvABC ATP-dependent DNA helicase subunit